MLNEREPHTALQANILAKCDSEDLSLVLARLQWSKSEIRYSLHASPKKMYSMWLPWEDFFSLAGFYRAARCAFLGRDCHVRWVTEGIDLAILEKGLVAAYYTLRRADEALYSCGLALSRAAKYGTLCPINTDGHTGTNPRLLEEAEDPTFRFRLSWMEGPPSKGWTFHYIPKRPDVESPALAAFAHMGIAQTAECPHNDFSPCYWRFVEFQGSGALDSNANSVHAYFRAHPDNFSSALAKVDHARVSLAPLGIDLLPPPSAPLPCALPNSWVSRMSTNSSNESAIHGALDREGALYELLIILFPDAASFHRWLTLAGAELKRLTIELPDKRISKAEYMHKAVELLSQQKLVDPSFFQHLRRHTPRQAEVIGAVQSRWIE